jgi:type I restriction enzyme S subunit
MFAAFIKRDDLAQRIDPEHHNPELLAMKKVVENSFPTSTFRQESSRMNSGPFGSALLSSAYVPKDKGVLFVRPQDCKNLIVDNDNDNVYISFEDNNRLKSSKFQSGAIIITKIGNGIGDMAVIPNSINECNISGNAMGAVLKNHDSYFAVSYLRGKYGQAEVKRGLSGGAKPKIDMDSIGSIVFPLISNTAQKYIGDKVRQAEHLRECAKKLRVDVDEELNSLNLPINEKPNVLNWIDVSILENRLDPRPYRSHYLGLVDKIEQIKHDRINVLADLGSGCPVSSNDFVENGEIPLVRIRNIGFDDFIGLDVGVNTEVFKSESKYHAKENMIVIGMDGIFRSQFFIADELPMLVNQRVAMLTPNNIRSELLTHWLNRPEGQMQLNQWAVKTTVEHTSLSDIGRILIPRLDDTVEEKLANKLKNARLAHRYAKFLIKVAKNLVEALIEGQINEEQIIKAQQALDESDNTLDQAILSNISSEGYAIKGAKLLFNDLDELYHLLQIANQDDAED